jgi:tetratricopeptide (TPR) repeat protein
MRTLLTIFTVLLLAVSLQAGSGSAGGTTSPFGLGAGSRDLALSGADMSSCDFAVAAFWNPSRLAQAEQFSLSGFHCRLFESDVAYQYFGVVVPTMDWGSVGIGVFRLGIDNIERRDADNMLTGSFGDNRMAYRLAYGRALGAYDIGVSLNLESHSLDNYRATSTPGADIAVSRVFDRAFPWMDNLRLSVVAHNVISPSMRLVDQTTKYPTEFQAGVSTRISFGSAHSQSLEISGMMARADAAPSSAAFGLEYSLIEVLKLRTGMRDDKMSFGAGLSFRGVSFDYALVDRDLAALHMVTLTASFGKPMSDRKKLRSDRREAAFTQAMNDRLEQRNRSLIGQLIEQGRKSLSDQDFATAFAAFDRALFLSRSDGLDTTEVSTLALNARDQMIALDNARLLSADLDSARTRLSGSDYLGCQYFAGLALNIDSTSSEAQSLQQQARDLLAQLASQKDIAQRQAWMIDSLLSYGFQSKALTLARTLAREMPSEPLAELTLKKAEFEFWKASSASLFAGQDYADALTSLDSALLRFPDQKWCLDLKEQCHQRLIGAEAAGSTAEKPAPAMSRELLKEIAGLYTRAQDDFQRGDLQSAISGWEKVEREAPNYQSVRQYLLKAYRFVGVELYGKNQLQAAMTVWKKALFIAPGNAEIAAYAKRTQNEIDKLKELSVAN